MTDHSAPTPTPVAAPVWPLPHALSLRDALWRAYDEPERGYHDTLHLAEVCQRLQELATAGEEFDERETLLAAWFHDAVYDGREGAEERSAAWAEQALPAAGVPDEATREVARLVRLTVNHDPSWGDRNGAALCDADLAILAAPPERYADYLAGVRREYAYVSDSEFAAGRAQVLRDLLAHETLFTTMTARERWEYPARCNLADELRSGHPSWGRNQQQPTGFGDCLGT